MARYEWVTPIRIELSHAGSYTAASLYESQIEAGVAGYSPALAEIVGYERGAMEPDGGTGRWTPGGCYRVIVDGDQPCASRIYRTLRGAQRAAERALDVEVSR